MTRPTGADSTGVIAVAACVLLMSSPVGAQLLIGFEDLSAGIGGVVDGPGESVVVGGIGIGCTGEEDTEFRFEYGALQVGGGVDVRRPGSMHGLRLSANYRRVYTEPRRNQFRVLVAYVFSVAIR